MKLVDRITCHDFVSMVQFLSDGSVKVGKKQLLETTHQ